MRSLANGPSLDLVHIPSAERRRLRRRIINLEGGLGMPLPAFAGPPPGRWAVRRDVDRSGAEAGAVAVLSAGEMLWHAAAIDPDVIAAADFARISDISDPLSFAAHAGDFAARWIDTSLRGYTAERLVMHRLVADGHAVEMAADSTIAGYDLLVDGAPVQVKAGTELSLLSEHFEQYPEIPVIANGALAEQALKNDAEWAPLLSTLPGFDLEAVERTVDAALAHADALAEADVVLCALGVGLLRGGVEVWRGAIPVEDLPAWLVIDGAARGALGLGGGQVGAWIGLVAVGPAGALVLGPAGACAALLGAGGLRGAVVGQLEREWRMELLERAATLHAALRAVLARRGGLLKARAEAVAARATGDSALAFWLRRRALEELLTCLDVLHGLGDPPADERGVFELLIEARRRAPTDPAVLRACASVEKWLDERPSLHNALGATIGTAMPMLRSKLPD